jgi:hypothetical protein
MFQKSILEVHSQAMKSCSFGTVGHNKEEEENYSQIPGPKAKDPRASAAPIIPAYNLSAPPVCGCGLDATE